MARFLWAVIFLLIIAGAGHTQAPAPAASPQPASTGRPDAVHPEAAQKSKSATALHPESARHSPEPQPADQQQKFMENLHRWQALSPEEREVLRQRQRLNEKKREESITEAYQKSGLHLSEEQRQQFRKRYLQERRKLEEQLVKEEQEKRLAGNAAIIESLKKEFAATPSGAGPSTGTPSTGGPSTGSPATASH